MLRSKKPVLRPDGRTNVSKVFFSASEQALRPSKRRIVAFESGGLSAAPLSLPSRAVRAAPTLSQLRLLGFRVPKLVFLGGAGGVEKRRNEQPETVEERFTDRGKLQTFK